ncbi:MAG: N-glycosylase/DNA lyase [Thermoplasmata archaeon]|nr:N-glycosylase/DNA lyase [Thermoplasmata archaeon]
MTQAAIINIKKIHAQIEPDIESRLNEFQQIWLNGTDQDIFAELVFCIFTPQSKAKSCWNAVERLESKGFLMNGSQHEIAATMTGVRFHNTKAERVIKARYNFFQGSHTLKSTLAGFPDPEDAREWLVENINGLGYKESSHFLRNIGMGHKLAILDRHILRNLVSLGVIREIPATISRKNYLGIEENMVEFSRKVEIPMNHLDLLLWYKEAGEIFK